MPGGLSDCLTSSPLDAASRYLDGLPDGVTVAVAVSGGSDSLGLLACLNDIASAHGQRVRLVALTVDHALRSGSAGEAAAVERFCHTLSIPHRTLVWQGEKPRTGLSAAARLARYRLLAEGARAFRAGCLVTAHTLNDQLETVEMRRRRREADNRGLAGIAPAALFFGAMPVHRPFLSVRRAAIRSFLGERGIEWVDDPSNSNPLFERARVRQSAQFVLGADEISVAARERLALSQAAADYVAAHVRMPMPMLFALDRAEAEEEITRLAIATLIAVAGGQEQLPGREQLDRLLADLRADGPRVAVSLGRTVVERRRQTIHIGRDLRNLTSETVSADGDAIWDGRFRIAGKGSQAALMGSAAVASAAGNVPPGIAQRALSALPDLAVLGLEGSGVRAVPYLAPFETVLSCFDLPLADAVCALTGRPVFPCFVSGGLETLPIRR